MQERKPFFPLTIGVVAVSFSAVLIKLSTAPSLVIASYRQLFAFLCLWPFAWWRYRSDLRNVSKRNMCLMICSGVFLALHFASWISSFNFTTVASSTALVSTQPIFAVIFSWLLFRDRIGQHQLLAILIAVVGSVIIGLADVGQGIARLPLWGNTLAMSGAIFGAGYFLCGEKVRQEMPVLPYVATVYGISALVLLVITLASGVPLFPYSAKDYFLFFGLAVACSVIGHSTMNWALAQMPATAVGVAALGEPIGATLWALLVFAEVPSIKQLLGGGLLLTGILLFMIRRSSHGLSRE